MRKLWIPGPAGRLEAALRVADRPRATVVVAHPHPQLGGTLDNAVVFHTERELHRTGMTTLRFNFRGVGGSEGRHDGGPGEVEDVAAAVAWLRGLSDAAPSLVCGYSFGSWCALRYAVRDRSIAGVIALGVPVELYDVSEAIRALGRPLLVVQAEADEFGGPDAVRAALAGTRPQAILRVVPATTHLFPGEARQVAAEVVAGVREWVNSW